MKVTAIQPKIPHEEPAMVKRHDPFDTDQALLEGCCRNDRNAQEQFYRKYHGGMLALCLRYTRNRSTALDIMNRGFLRVFSKINEYRPTGSLTAWIKVIMVHAIADYFREHNKLPVQYTGLAPKDETLFVEPDKEFTKELLQKALEQLTDTQRLVFNLFAIEGYPHREIAALCRMNENTVRWVYAEAKKKLKQILTHLL